MRKAIVQATVNHVAHHLISVNLHIINLGIMNEKSTPQNLKQNSSNPISNSTETRLS